MKNPPGSFGSNLKVFKNHFSLLKIQLHPEIVDLIHQGVSSFCIGSDVAAYDTLAAQTVLNLKPVFPHIRLILILPSSCQAGKQSREDKKIHNQILRQADQVVYRLDFPIKTSQEDIGASL